MQPQIKNTHTFIHKHKLKEKRKQTKYQSLKNGIFLRQRDAGIPGELLELAP